MTTLRWNETPRQRLVRRARAVLVAVCCLIGVAATSRVVLVDLLQWRDAGQLARTVAADPSLRARDRANAIVVMERDVLRSLELLRQIAAEGGEASRHAENALKEVDAARGWK